MQNQSRLEKMIKEGNAGETGEEIHFSLCQCKICANDMRPLVDPPSPRQKSVNQYKLKDIAALSHLLQKLTANNHPRILFIPDIYIIDNGIFCYTNQSGKIRLKTQVNSYEAKKLFEQRRKKNTSRTQAYSLASINREKSKERENNILIAYHGGYKQLINELELKKIFAKRKNDSFWSQAAAILYIPTNKPIEYHQWTYRRNREMGKRLDKIIKTIGEEVDAYDHKLDIDESHRNNKEMIQKMNMSMSYFSQPGQFSSNKKNNLFQNIPMNSSLQFSMLNSQSNFDHTIEDQFMETIAYLQLATKTRILSVDIQYLFDEEGKPYVTNIIELIAHQLHFMEVNSLHDRYKPLDSIMEEQLTILKKQLDEKDKEQLENLCGNIVAECLEERKRILKIENYVRPSRESLKGIFMKFFPEFDSEQMLSSVNWKNQLPGFMSNSRKHITAMIKEDEGVSILKRFGIVFFRTFD